MVCDSSVRVFSPDYFEPINVDAMRLSTLREKRDVSINKSLTDHDINVVESIESIVCPE